ncbi:immunoglobulin-like domain-containing protein [Enterococcus mundtii]|uniref:DUF5011 domain-containing protein n=1 Tax=Enterococcus mundtii TaxID=53346 RepID=A0A242KWZ5_ENTMU|nr:immunoglobulin-like domain-containing protein [Enterococcus mundtii]OTP26379.1 hypothetical protein A5802_000090 [Enterococcus mundtii]
MSKKKLTKKRKKQLLAMFMAAGIMTNTMVSTGIAFADINPTISNISNKVIQQDGAIPFVNLGPDEDGDSISSVAIVDGKLQLTTLTPPLRIFYDIVGSNSPEFNMQEATFVDRAITQNKSTFTASKKVSDYPNFKYFYIINYADLPESQIMPMIRLNGTDLGKYEKPVLENPYIYQTDLKGKTTPDTDVLISDYENFGGYITVHSDVSGNFTVPSSSLNSLAKHTPGTTLYVKSGNIESTSYSEVATTLIHYPTPKVTESYAYDTEIKGIAYPNSQVYISDKNDFGRYVTVKADSSGNFTAPVSLLKNLAGYQKGNTLYFRSAEVDDSQAMSLTASTKITEENIITPTSGYVRFGSSLSLKNGTPGATVRIVLEESGNQDDEAALQLDNNEGMEVVLDNNGDAVVTHEELCRGLENYQTSDHGFLYYRAYSGTSKGELRNVQVLHSSSQDQTTITAHDFSLDYGEEFNDEIAIEKAEAKATDKYGKEEAVTVKESNVDTSKPGEYSITFVSASGKEKTVKVTVKDAPEANATIEANDFTLDYGEEFNDEIAIEKAGAKATDKYGKEEGVKVKESNVDTNRPGEYSITFVSDSGKEKTVKVTVKEQVATKPAPPVIRTDPYYYGDNLIGDIAPGLVAKVYPQGHSEKSLEFTTSSGTFAFTPDEMKEAFGDLYRPNNVLAVIAYDPKTGLTSAGTGVYILPKEDTEVAPTLQAEDTIHVAYGSDWSDEIAKKQAKVKATDGNGNDVTENVKVISNPVDTSKPGSYTVEFSVTANDLTTSAKTTVIVDEKQVIGSEPIIHATDTTYQVGETLNPLLGVTAEDPEDGDLTDQVKADASGVNMSKAGDYELKLSVTDKDGNTTEQAVTVHVVDQVTDGPVIKGADDVKVDERAKFDPLEGVTAQDSQGNDVTDNLTYTGSVDTSTPGEYTIKYYVYDKDGNVATTERVVTVQSDASKPVVMSPDKLTIKQNSKFDPTLYAQAYDNEDGDITDQIKVLGQIYTDKVGQQFITYEVTDSDGNKASKIMEVDVVETLGNAPVISGADDIEINVGDTFDPISNVTAYDNEDGDLTSEIKYGGIVDTGKAGEYKITYTVWDSDFNTETVERNITVKENIVAPTIESEKEIHVPYGSEWNDDIAKEQAKVKATDSQGNDVTKDVVVTSNPVDTTKSGSYTVEFSVTADGLTSKSQTTVIVDEQEKDYLLEPNEYVIGKDAYVTGKAGEDVKFVALYKEENGKRVFYKRAPVVDGQIKVYASGLINDKDQVIYAVAEDENQQTILADGKNVEKQVQLSVLGEDVNYQLSPDDYILGTQYITGTYDNDKADHLRLRVDGKIVNTIYPDKASDEFKMYANSVASTDQKVDILEYNGDELLTTQSVTIKEAQEITYNLSANEYTIGDTYITGEYDNQYADTVKLIVDGKVVKLTHPNSSKNSYKILASSYIDSTEHEVYIAEYKGTQELSRVRVNVNQPKVYEINPDTYNLGEASITGKWNSDDDSVKYLNLYVNDQRVAINVLSEDGTFNINTKNTIKNPTDKVELQLADANKSAVGDKVPVTVQKNDYQLKINEYTIGDAKVTGSFDSRYTTDKDQIQLVIDGTVAKQVVYNAADTNPGKENEEFTIVAKGLITDKNQEVTVRHIKDGKLVVEQALVIK